MIKILSIILRDVWKMVVDCWTGVVGEFVLLNKIFMLKFIDIFKFKFFLCL